VRNSENEVKAPKGSFEVGGARDFQNQPVAGARNARDGNATESAAKGFAKLMKKEIAISFLEPELVVVNDDGRRRRSSAGGSCDAIGGEILSGSHFSLANGAGLCVVYSRSSTASQGQLLAGSPSRSQAKASKYLSGHRSTKQLTR